MLNKKHIQGLDRNAPIGIFDSGVGGLTVVRAFETFLPDEKLIYFGDTARYPYGPRSARIVTEFAVQNAELLAAQGIKLLVVACNTASSVAMETVAAAIDIPLIGVIEPGARAVIRESKTGRIGVIGTEGTIRSGSYQHAISELDPIAEYFTKACPLFVALAQEGFSGQIVQLVAEHYLASLKEEQIDSLILGCTHYPLLIEDIQAVVGDGVRLVDSAESTVLEVREFLRRKRLLGPDGAGDTRYMVSDAPELFREIGERFLQHPIPEVKHIRLR